MNNKNKLSFLWLRQALYRKNFNILPSFIETNLHFLHISPYFFCFFSLSLSHSRLHSYPLSFPLPYTLYCPSSIHAPLSPYNESPILLILLRLLLLLLLFLKLLLHHSPSLPHFLLFLTFLLILTLLPSHTSSLPYVPSLYHISSLLHTSLSHTLSCSPSTSLPHTLNKPQYFPHTPYLSHSFSSSILLFFTTSLPRLLLFFTPSFSHSFSS